MPLAAGVEFLEEPLAVFGVLLMIGALVSGLARRSFLSLTAAFVIAGFVLGKGGLEILDLDPTSDFVQGLAVVALVLILFRDGLEVEQEMLQEAWHLPLRKLGARYAAHLRAGGARDEPAGTDLSWTECFLVGALLSPTDPVLSSAVVTNPRVPRLIRHSLNLESGLNDGLALPAVLAFTAAAAADRGLRLVGVRDPGPRCRAPDGAARRVRRRAADAEGAGTRLRDQPAPEVDVRAGRRLRRLRDRDAAARGQRIHRRIRDARSRSASGGRTSCTAFEDRAEDIIEVVKLGVFLVFGAIFTFDTLFEDGWSTAAIAVFTLLAARPIAVFVALAGNHQVDTAGKAFMAWFGPRASRR